MLRTLVVLVAAVLASAPALRAQEAKSGDLARQLNQLLEAKKLDAVAAADPDTPVVALSGDYDFQFLVEEMAVGAQFHLPYIHVVVNNSYLGLIRQSQRGFEMDYCVQLAFDNVNSPELAGYGVDHVKVAEGLGCKAVRVERPEYLASAFDDAKKLVAEFRVPVLVEVILERVTNIAMGTELDNVVEFEELATLDEHAPTAIALLD